MADCATKCSTRHNYRAERNTHSNLTDSGEWEEKNGPHKRLAPPPLSRILRKPLGFCRRALRKGLHSRKPAEEPSHRTPKVLQNFGTKPIFSSPANPSPGLPIRHDLIETSWMPKGAHHPTPRTWPCHPRKHKKPSPCHHFAALFLLYFPWGWAVHKMTSPPK